MKNKTKQAKATIQSTEAHTEFTKQQRTPFRLKIDKKKFNLVMIKNRFHIQSIFELFTLFMYFKLQALFTDGRNTHVMILTGACSRSTLWVVEFNHHLAYENPMKTSTKRISVGKIGPTTTPVKSQSEDLTFHQVICAHVVLGKQLCFRFCVLSRRFPKNCHLGKPFTTAHDGIWIARGNSIIVARSVSVRGTAQPSSAKWFLQFPPGYNLTATVMEVLVD